MTIRVIAEVLPRYDVKQVIIGCSSLRPRVWEPKTDVDSRMRASGIEEVLVVGVGKCPFA